MAHKGATLPTNAPDDHETNVHETLKPDQQQTTDRPVGLIDFNTIPRAIFRIGLNGQELSTVLNIASGLELTPDDDDALLMLTELEIICIDNDNQPVIRQIKLDEVETLSAAIALYREEADEIADAKCVLDDEDPTGGDFSEMSPDGIHTVDELRDIGPEGIDTARGRR